MKLTYVCNNLRMQENGKYLCKAQYGKNIV